MEDGVVGCVDSASDGACEVVGVAEPDGSRACTAVSGVSRTSAVEEGFS